MTVVLGIDAAWTPNQPSGVALIPDGPPEVLGIVQNADPDVDRFGRVVAVLFDEDIGGEAASDPASYGIGVAEIPVIRSAARFHSRILNCASTKMTPSCMFCSS